MANTPVEFMLHGGNIELLSLYIGDETEVIGSVPDHDVALLAIGESPDNRAILQKCRMLIENWPRVVLNFNIEAILQLDRSHLWHRLADLDGLHCPWTVEFERQELLQDPQAAISRGLNNKAISFPLIIRPEGAHAGTNTFKVDSMAEFSTALAGSTANRLTVSHFIDYKSDDGQFRKYRIALINGVAYPAHMAISSKWMVHYLNAGMTESSLKREEEARWLNEFDKTFAVRHATGFTSLCDALKLDYFAIDCAETTDGQLLIFEIDTAMIVHCMDVGPEFAYKKAPMQKLFNAFQSMLALPVETQLFSEAS